MPSLRYTILHRDEEKQLINDRVSHLAFLSILFYYLPIMY